MAATLPKFRIVTNGRRYRVEEHKPAGWEFVRGWASVPEGHGYSYILQFRWFWRAKSYVLRRINCAIRERQHSVSWTVIDNA